MSKGKHITVAEYLTEQINICGKSQKEIAEDIGYEKHNMITMLKQGKTRIPINKVPAMAKSLGVDKIHFLKLVMNEYMPAVWEAIEDCVGDNTYTENERELIKTVRENSDGLDLSPQTEEQREELIKAIASWREHHEKMADASRRRVERDNPHMKTTVDGSK